MPEVSPRTPDDLSERRILVTGASGFIGSCLVRRLLKAGATVGAVGRSHGLLEPLPAHPQFEFVQCDLVDPSATFDAITAFRPHVLVHLAAHPDERESHAQAHRVIEANATGTLNVLEGFRQAGGELFLYGDSVKVYGNCEVPYREHMPAQPTSSYAVAKLAGWHLCELYQRVHGVSVAAVRPTLIYGPGQRFNLFSVVANSVLEGREEIRLNGGDQTRDPLYIDDAVEAFVAAIRRGRAIAGRCVIVGGGTERSVRDLSELVVSIMGGTQKVIGVADSTRPTEIWRSYCDNVEAADLIGWSPATDIVSGLRRTIAWIGRHQRVRLAA